jgi:hypothetical protein
MTQETIMSQILDIGSQVLFRVGGSDEHPQLRPAQAVSVHSQQCANLVVTFDGWNDHKSRHKGEKGEFASDAEAERCVGWRTSVLRGNGVGQWRFPSVESANVEPAAPEPAPDAKPKKTKAEKPTAEAKPAGDEKPPAEKPPEGGTPAAS